VNGAEQDWSRRNPLFSRNWGQEVPDGVKDFAAWQKTIVHSASVGPFDINVGKNACNGYFNLWFIYADTKNSVSKDKREYIYERLRPGDKKTLLKGEGGGAFAFFYIPWKIDESGQFVALEQRQIWNIPQTNAPWEEWRKNKFPERLSNE